MGHIYKIVLYLLALWDIVYCTGSRRFVTAPPMSLKPPSLDRHNSKTTVACEGNELQVACEEGKVIRLVRANYGRFSISTCNDHGHVDWSVNCMSYKSFLIMQDRCSQKQSCGVGVSSKIFGDPCPGTLKYLEVQYHCVSPSFFTSTTRKSTVLANTSSTADVELPSETTPDAETSSSPEATTSSAAPSSSSVASTSGTQKYYPSTAPLVTTTPRTTTSRLTTVFVMTSPRPPPNHCPPVVVNDIHWNWTKAGTEAIHRCPGGATGLARWQCGADPVRWMTPHPDLRECRSGWVINLKKRIESGESINSVAAELALMTFVKTLYADDLKDVAEVIQQTLSRAINGMETFHDLWHKYHVLRELLQSLLETISNLLKPDQTAWKDLSLAERKRVASSLLEGLEESAMLLAQSSGKEDSFTLAEANVFLSVQVLNARTSAAVQFPMPDDFRGDMAETSWIRMEDTLILPAQALQDISKHGLAKVVFVVYSNIGEILKPGAGFRPPSYHKSHHSKDETRNSSWVINSKVIAASVGKPGMMRLSQPVLITFRHLQEDNMTNPVCVFWDFDAREWSTEGCWVQASNTSHTTCSCDHLTNFAVVMEVGEMKVEPVSHNVLHVIITVGCGLAICCIILTVLPIFIIRSLSGDTVTVHKNLLVCLLLAEVVLLGGVELTWEPIMCAIVAALLDYLLLATICWAFLECFQLYVELADMAQPQKSRWAWYYSLAYSVPGLIVSVAAIVDCKSYGTERICWLRSDNYFIFSFIGPAVGIYFGGMVFLCVASCILYHHSSLTTTIKGKEEAKLSKIKSNIRRAVLLMCILGTTWTTGLLYLHQETLSLAYAFTVFNSAQGVFILVFYCVTDEKIQPQLERFGECWLPGPLQRSKGNLPPSSALTPGTPGQHSVECQEVESPSKQGNCSANLTSTTLGPLYTTSTSNQIEECQTAQVPKISKELYGPLQKGVELYNHEEVVAENRESPCKVWLPYEWQRRLDRQYLGAGELYGPFSEHIYESVDGDYGYSGNPRSVAGEYGYRSDLSQHSSSSYGYDQRPLLILPRHPGHGDYGSAWRHSPDKHRRRHRGHRRSSSDKVSVDIPEPAPPERVVVESTQAEEPAGAEQEWNLPDLLRCPADNTVVMAVLDGEKVVSRVQPECPRYNLSTYC